MVRAKTPKLGLIIESDDELVDQFDYNWSILDSVADALIVADGATPADADLFDGRMVAETSTGKIWIARKNQGTGSYDKQWVFYPFSMECSSTPATAVGSFSERTFSGITDGLNATALVNGRIQVPIKGIYHAWMRLSGPTYSGTPNTALFTKIYNNGNALEGTERAVIVNPSNTTTLFTQLVLSMNGGESLSFGIASLGANTPNTSVRFGVSLISPMGTVS